MPTRLNRVTRQSDDVIVTAIAADSAKKRTLGTPIGSMDCASQVKGRDPEYRRERVETDHTRHQTASDGLDTNRARLLIRGLAVGVACGWKCGWPPPNPP
jgi:hypothetical protein